MTDTQAQIDRAPVADKLALALDVDDLVAALRMARSLKPWFGVAKVGLELYSAAGPDAVGALRELGYEVFCDVKLHDIPTTVHRAARVLGALGVSYITMHAQGGGPMLAAGVEGLAEGCADSDVDAKALAVTVLTSDPDAPSHIMPKRVILAVESGCHGLVCSAADLRDAHSYVPRLMRVVPGIRLAGTRADDHARAATPGSAIEAGADLLVIGRAVTGAKDPQAAAEQLHGELAGS